MKILITGARGMVGRNISEHQGMLNNVLFTPSRKELDLSDYKRTKEYIQYHSPDMIIHCAGKVGGIQANISNPVNFLIDNFDIGRNVIIASRDAGVKKLLNMGSSCMYPRDSRNPLKEEYILKGELEKTNEGYALAKIFSTRLCEYINIENSKYHYKTVIPCNLFGKYDKFSIDTSHLIPAVIRKIHSAKITNEKTIEIWGDGTARREFMYAEDLADFVSYSLDKFDELPSIMNVGLGFDYTINEYYQKIAKLLGFTGRFINNSSKPVGMKQKLVDTTKLKLFGWEPKTSLTKGLESTIEYYTQMEKKS